ncbi:MAG: acetolactate synthase small subunit [Deltaproteobacteria bacterium]|nr:acetolactate synthase small subunit [Deltaproteobacteria bacterium]
MTVRENTISILVNNKPDVLARIAGTFSGRGFNIESISANITRNPEITNIIITTIGDQETVIKLEKQLNKLVDVLEVRDLTDVSSAQREMILVRMKVTASNRDRFTQIVDIHSWKIVSTDADYCILEVTGDRQEIEDSLSLLETIGMEDFVRTGIVALKRCSPQQIG